MSKNQITARRRQDVADLSRLRSDVELKNGQCNKAEATKTTLEGEIKVCKMRNFEKKVIYLFLGFGETGRSCGERTDAKSGS